MRFRGVVRLAVLAMLLVELVSAETTNVVSRTYTVCQQDQSCFKLRLLRTMGSPYTLSGSAIISKAADGRLTSREFPIIDYTISDAGVPATITFPAFGLGQADSRFALFFAGDKLELVGPGCNPRCVLKAK